MYFWSICQFPSGWNLMLWNLSLGWAKSKCYQTDNFSLTSERNIHVAPTSSFTRLLSFESELLPPLQSERGSAVSLTCKLYWNKSKGGWYTKFLFSFACSATSGQVLENWSITGGQFGCDFITLVMKSNCNKNEKMKSSLEKLPFHQCIYFLAQFFRWVFFPFPVSLNGLNYLIIFNSSSQSVERGKRGFKQKSS